MRDDAIMAHVMGFIALNSIMNDQKQNTMEPIDIIPKPNGTLDFNILTFDQALENLSEEIIKGGKLNGTRQRRCGSGRG